MLQESVSDHRHQGVPMQTLPGSTLEVIETQFFFNLLMRLFADPSGFDDRRQTEQLCIVCLVGKIILRLAAGAALSDQPDFLTRKMLLPLVADPLRRPVGHAHADGCKPCPQCALGSLPPTDRSPSGGRQNLFGWP